MRNYVLVALALSLLVGFQAIKQPQAPRAIEIHQFEGELVTTITDGSDVEVIGRVIESATRIPGILDVTKPNYTLKVKFGSSTVTYLLWLADGKKGMLMNASDTHTVYRLKEDSTQNLKRILLKNSANAEFFWY